MKNSCNLTMLRFLRSTLLWEYSRDLFSAIQFYLIWNKKIWDMHDVSIFSEIKARRSRGFYYYYYLCKTLKVLCGKHFVILMAFAYTRKCHHISVYQANFCLKPWISTCDSMDFVCLFVFFSFWNENATHIKKFRNSHRILDSLCNVAQLPNFLLLLTTNPAMLQSFTHTHTLTLQPFILFSSTKIAFITFSHIQW